METFQETTTKQSILSGTHGEPIPATLASSMQSAVPPPPPPLPTAPSPPAKDVPEANSSVDASKDSKAELHPTPSKSALLQQQIQTLTSLQRRMGRIRSLPTHLLIFHSQSPLISFGGLSGLGLGDGNGPSESDTINSILNADAGTEVTSQAREMGLQPKVAFRMLNDAREELVKNATQNALKAAHESEAQDKSDIALHGRRTRKKRRIANADSPAPFPSFHVETKHVFPPPKPEDRKIEDLNDLVMFIRDFNRSKSIPRDPGSRTRLGIWTPSRPKSGTSAHVSDPLTVRVTIHDVTTVFVKLRHPDRDRGARQLVVESMVALGPREKKGPYSHSEFTVYQKLTQYVAGMLEKEPDVSFTQVVDLLTSYEDLFITHCSVCQRELPLEGHVPPVGRVWKESSITAEGEQGRWEARHISCLHA